MFTTLTIALGLGTATPLTPPTGCCQDTDRGARTARRSVARRFGRCVALGEFIAVTGLHRLPECGARSGKQLRCTNTASVSFIVGIVPARQRLTSQITGNPTPPRAAARRATTNAAATITTPRYPTSSESSAITAHTIPGALPTATNASA